MRRSVLLIALALGGCAAPRLINTGQVNIVAANDLPAPSRADLSGGERTHLVGPFDRLAVEVFGLAELSRQVQVDANGFVSLPLAGSVQVSGRTPQELEVLLADRLRSGYVRDPRVTVSVLETVSQTLTVDGQVRTPGLYPVVGNMTLMRAIARAQGTTEFAQTTHVVIFRTVGGQRMAALHDLRSIRLAAYPDPQVYPNDVIVVGESTARRIFPQILQAASLLVAPLVTVLDNNN